MAITRKVEASYYDSSGERHATIEDAQRAELIRVLKPIMGRVWDSQTASGVDNGVGVQYLSSLADEILAVSDVVLNVLTTGPRSRPKARKQAGTTNPRRATKRATAEQAKAGFQAMRDTANEGTTAARDGDVPANPDPVPAGAN